MGGVPSQCCGPRVRKQERKKQTKGGKHKVRPGQLLLEGNGRKQVGEWLSTALTRARMRPSIGPSPQGDGQGCLVWQMELAGVPMPSPKDVWDSAKPNPRQEVGRERRWWV